MPLKGILAFQPPFVIYDHRVHQQARPENGTKLKQMDQVIAGMFAEIGSKLAKDMNFRLQYFVRWDYSWGRRLTNGTWTGLVGNLLDDDVDFIGTSLTLTLERFSVIDFALPLGKETFALFISRKPSEEYAWFSYFLPFKNQLWLFLFINSLVMISVITLLNGVYYRGNPLTHTSVLKLMYELAHDYWSLMASYLGRAHQDLIWTQHLALRLFLTIVIFVGSIVFISYRASLTSELSVTRETWPFNSLEGLLASDYV